jgi:hypothetical protein
MEKRLKIYTFPDKNPEFLQLQIDSFKKFMDDGNTDLIIVNTSNSYASEIESICVSNNIEIMPYDGVRVPFPQYVVEQYAWFRETIQKNTNDYILLIHSDMFFVNKLDYKKLMSDKKIYFNPQYRDTPFNKIHDGSFTYFYMWDGIVLFDSEYFNENDLTKYFDWGFINGITDVGGQTYNLIKNIESTHIGYFEMWTHHALMDNTLSSSLNGSVPFTLNLDDKIIKETSQMPNKSFPYENDHDDYLNYVSEKVIKLTDFFIKPFDFEKPVDSDLIQILGGEIENAPIFHFKSGSEEKNKNRFHKLEQIKKIIFRDEI